MRTHPARKMLPFLKYDADANKGIFRMQSRIKRALSNADANQVCEAFEQKSTCFGLSHRSQLASVALDLKFVLNAQPATSQPL